MLKPKTKGKGCLWLIPLIALLFSLIIPVYAENNIIPDGSVITATSGTIDGTVIGGTTPAAGTFTSLTRGDVSDTEFSYLNGVTSAIQTQFSNILDGTTNFTLLDVDNLRFNGNTASTTDTNGDFNLDPDGIGNVNIVSGNLELGGVELQTPTQNLSANLLNKAKGDVISSIYSIVGATNIKGLWLFDQYGASTTVTDRGLLAQNATLSANASTLSPGV
ncbi:MAG: hypothetical protein RLY43_231, partial [Bacteroidota bacterium]